MNVKDIVRLWYKTQVGNIHKCRKNQLIFADIMWKLYGNLDDTTFMDTNDNEEESLGDHVI